MSKIGGYYGRILYINLTNGKIEKREIAEEDLAKFVGGRGVGVKILWDHLKKPGVDPFADENPLIFMTG
ncbi:MAG: aldehyde:ferredoxin oxidoreductase, partial [Thermodesulfovibrionales bacterium]|nr:aldehyde:ferredoxin oxidoreductase [Thermodesulfovibrionales bacterium]